LEEKNNADADMDCGQREQIHEPQEKRK